VGGEEDAFKAIGRVFPAELFDVTDRESPAAGTQTAELFDARVEPWADGTAKTNSAEVVLA
jgi:hypothetical protein